MRMPKLNLIFLVVMIFSFTLVLSSCKSTNNVKEVKSINNSEAQKEEKNKEIKRLLKLTKSDDMFKMVIEQQMGMIRNMAPEVPEKFWNDFEEEAYKGMDAMNDKIVDIYSKYLTYEEVKGIADFYQTDLGKRLIEVTPEITMDAMKLGQEWGIELGTKIIDKINEGRERQD
ncbi:MAG: DUF2059 domain-containing protein [Deltaproteobacteria bacterium]|nr:DUF2059 domain-containing protein [Deltaproteobacteria bacterium]